MKIQSDTKSPGELVWAYVPLNVPSMVPTDWWRLSIVVGSHDDGDGYEVLVDGEVKWLPRLYVTRLT